jgi:hypothetical protein
MNRDKIDILLSLYLVVASAVFILFAVLACVNSRGARDVEQEAIKHGHAYYHPETGAFTWKEAVK